MTYRLTVLILAGSAIVAAAPVPDVPPPKLIGVFSASADAALPLLPSGLSYSVATFAFSPDEKWLAVVLGTRPIKSGKAPVPDSALLLVPLQGGDSRRIRIDPSLRTGLLWSPDSKSVLIQTNTRGPDPAKIYNLRGELTWTGPPSGPLIGFIAPERLLAMHVKPGVWLSGFDKLDMKTRNVTPWRALSHDKFVALDSDGGLLAVFPDAEGSRILIVDSTSGKAVRPLKSQNRASLTECSYSEANPPGECGAIFSAGEAYFAENGKTLCQATLVGAFQTHPACQDIETGATISQFPGFSGGAPAGASSNGSRMVLTRINGLPRGVRAGRYSGSVVWDFRSGSEVAAWQSPLSSRAGGWPTPAVAISVFGHYVAEVLGDEVRIYRLP